MVKELGQILALGLMHYRDNFVGFLEDGVTMGRNHLAIADDRDNGALVGEIERFNAFANGF